MANHSPKPDQFPLSRNWTEAMAKANPSGEAELPENYTKVVPPVSDGTLPQHEGQDTFAGG